MEEYKRFNTFKKYYEYMLKSYIDKKIFQRRNDFKLTRFIDSLKKILISPINIVKSLDNFNNDLHDTYSSNIVSGSIAIFYINVFLFFFYSYNIIMDIIKDFFEGVISAVYYSKNSHLIIALSFVCLFLILFIVNHLIKKILNKLSREKSLKYMLETRYEKEFNEKKADEKMLECFFYFCHADLYKEAVSEMFEDKNFIQYIDLLNIEKK